MSSSIENELFHELAFAGPGRDVTRAAARGRGPWPFGTPHPALLSLPSKAVAVGSSPHDGPDAIGLEGEAHVPCRLGSEPQGSSPYGGISPSRTGVLRGNPFGGAINETVLRHPSRARRESPR